MAIDFLNDIDFYSFSLREIEIWCKNVLNVYV